MKTRLRSPCDSCQPLSPTICIRPAGMQSSSSPRPSASHTRSASPIPGRRRPPAAHQQVEGQGAGEDVVLVKLRYERDAPPPPRAPAWRGQAPRAAARRNRGDAGRTAPRPASACRTRRSLPADPVASINRTRHFRSAGSGARGKRYTKSSASTSGPAVGVPSVSGRGRKGRIGVADGLAPRGGVKHQLHPAPGDEDAQPLEHAGCQLSNRLPRQEDAANRDGERRGAESAEHQLGASATSARSIQPRTASAWRARRASGPRQSSARRSPSTAGPRAGAAGPALPARAGSGVRPSARRGRGSSPDGCRSSAPRAVAARQLRPIATATQAPNSQTSRAPPAPYSRTRRPPRAPAPRTRRGSRRRAPASRGRRTRRHG